MHRTTLIGLALAVGLLASACGGDGGVLGSASSDTAPAERYSAAVRDSYLDGCVQEAPLEACECTIREFEARYTEVEFIRLALENADNEDIAAEFFDIIAACTA